MPDWNMEDQLVNVFGRRGYPVRRYWRMMYWMPKFKNASPWHLPEKVPNDAFQLAMLAVKRMTSVDVTSEISVFKVIFFSFLDYYYDDYYFYYFI